MNKKNLKFVSAALLMAATLGTTFTGCKDYDDDIDNLQAQIDANADAIKKIQDLVNSGSTITSVTSSTNGVTVTMSDGKSFQITNGINGTNGTDGTNGTNGTNGTVWTIESDGFWYKDGVKTDYVAIGKDGADGEDGKDGVDGTNGTDGTDGKDGVDGVDGKDGDTYVPGEDGYWYLNEVKPENKTDKMWVVPGVVSVADNGDHYLFSNLMASDGTSTTAKISKYSSSFVASLVHVPSNINALMGDVIFLPVIGTDENSEPAQGIYEYNWSLKPFALTMVNGWAEYEYKVNPSSVAPDNYDGVGFVEKAATLSWGYNPETRATETGLPTWKIGTKEAGKLIIKASADGLNMVKQGNIFDDPVGKPASELSKYGEYAKVNTLAFMIKNTNADEALLDEGKVVSDFVATKRMVVLQWDLMIGAAIGQDKELSNSIVAPNYTNLSHMYPVAYTDAEKQQYKEDEIPVIAEVLYTDEPVLGDYIKDYALRFSTNTNFYSDYSQYRLGDLGFENITFKYYLESYKEAEVDQTLRYLTVDENTGKIAVTLDADGKKQTAAINREPLIKIKMFVDGQFVMSKFMKLKLVETKQLTDDFAAELNDHILGCTPLVGGSDMKVWYPEIFADAKVVDGLKIDFDPIFNKLGISKDKFVELYSISYTPGNTGDGFSIEVTKDGAPFTDFSYYDGQIYADDSKNLIIDWNNIYGNATSVNNYVYFGLQNQLEAGKYDIKFTFSTYSSVAAYKSFTVSTSFNVIDPKPMWYYEPGMWNKTENMIAYGKPTSENGSSNPFIGPFIMTSAIEDGFKKYSNEDLGSCGMPYFELVDPEKYDGNVYITYDKETEKHMLTIEPYVCKWVGEKIRVRAKAAVGSSEQARTIKALVDATGTDEFDIIFVDPVSYAEVNDGSWYLVDKAADDVNEGSYLPVYRLFKLWDTHKTQTNGMMWDPALPNGWFVRNNVQIGKSLFNMHGVKIEYTIDPNDNKPFVLEHATITNGVIKWSNNQGTAVVTEEPITVTVKVNHLWNAECEPIIKKIVVKVKSASTEYSMPKIGFLKSGDPLVNDPTLGIDSSAN